MLETGRRRKLKLTAKKRSVEYSKDQRQERLPQAPPPGPSQGPRRLQGTPELSHHVPVQIL